MRWTLLAIVAVALGALSSSGATESAEPRIELVDGTLSLQNSLEGQAVFTVDGLGPGHATSGGVTLTNAGTLAGDLTLSLGGLSDAPGPGGAPLSGQLRLLVRDLTRSATAYDGPLATMGELALGRLGPGASRVYELTASLPASVDESVAGASMSASYTWTAVESAPDPPPPVAPPPVAPPPPGGGSDLRQPLRLRVWLPARQPLLRRGRLVTAVRSDRSCRIVSRAQLPAGRGRSVSTRPRAVRLRGGRVTRVVLRVPRRRAVMRALPGVVTLTVSARANDGATRTVRKRPRIRVGPR